MIDVKKIADNADMIVNGYAFTKDNELIRVLNLEHPTKASVLNITGEMIETTMDDIEVEIVTDIYLRNKNNLYSIDKVVTIESNKVFNVYKNLVKYNDKYLTTKVKKELLIDWCTICIDNFDLNNDYSNFDLVCLLRDNYKTYLSKLR